ncbi:MAG: GFA family protein [Paracoccaceae bacterium]
MTEHQRKTFGHCLCGAVAFEILGDLNEPHACHCNQCRRQSGHYSVSTHVKRKNVKITKDRGLKWFRSSDKAQRGFCAVCGSSLFWDGGDEELYISVGSLNTPTGLKLAKHIYVDEVADYYTIGDGLPKYEGFDRKIPEW